MNWNIGLVGWILCSKPCVISLLEGLLEKDIVEADADKRSVSAVVRECIDARFPLIWERNRKRRAREKRKAGQL